jgi:SulP family sulfate permease
MILFPLGQPIFAGLGPNGISMFYISCIVSQLVYSCGGSIFKGGVGSEMVSGAWPRWWRIADLLQIEVVPFFHKMAFTILARVGEDNPKSVLATTILSYSISSVVTGAVFFLMGACKLGSLVGFFPRHILIGCIGGVGWFLVATGLEVSARLDGNLEYNLVTLSKLVQLDTIFLWMIPLVLAIVLLVSQRWVKSSVFVPLYFLVIPAVFYFFVAAIPDLKLDRLRELGWVFAAPEAGKPWYDFYTLYGKHRPSLLLPCPHVWLTIDRSQGCELASPGRNHTGDVCLDFLWRPSCPDQCPCLGPIYRERHP